MNTYYLAVDIGASSGRHILSHIENGKLILEEIYRFPNGMIDQKNEKIWDVDTLFQNIVEGMKVCKETGRIPVSMGIDTWGVDFVLLDEKDERIGNAVAYRDGRTEEMDQKVYEIISEEKLYSQTGLQKQIFNTIYQLMALKVKKPEDLKKAKSLLMIPDYFHYKLTGIKINEYTNASTTQLLSPITKDWDTELIEALGYPSEIFQKIVTPGTLIGDLTKEIQEQVGYNCQIILPATHDTGSAVVAVPTNEEDVLYISSGTWSLMGTERLEADCSQVSKAHNFTNEGGYEYRFRYLKNIMGLWMIQSVRKEIASEMGFDEICKRAAQCTIPSIVDVNDNRFLAPEHMTKEVQKACEELGQQVPVEIGEVASVIYNSLAKCYARTVQEIEEMTDKNYPCIHIVGGGAHADYLNQLTARETNKTIFAGPAEATAIGNTVVQMLASGELKNLSQARECIFNSFEIKVYNP